MALARLLPRLLVILLLAGAPGTGPAAAQSLTPLVVNWDRYFSVDWEASERGGRTLLSGQVRSVQKYAARWMQLLVDRLDASGALLDQRLVWLPSEVPRGGRVYWEARVEPAARYRVSVYSFEILPRP